MNKYGLNLQFEDKNLTQQSVSHIEVKNEYDTLKLSHLRQLFDDMDEIVYVIDMDTYELVYMNRLQLSILGYQRLEDALGKKCYNVLQGNSVPCPFCPNEKLETTNFYSWSYYHPVVERQFLLKDIKFTDGRKRYHLEMSVDITKILSQHQSRQSFHEMERDINEGIRLAMSAPTPDVSLQSILDYLGRLLGGERAYIIEQDDKLLDTNTYEWVFEGVLTEIDMLQKLPSEICSIWYQRFQSNEAIIIPDIEQISKGNLELYNTLKRQNINSIAIMPLYDNQDYIGFLGIDNPLANKLTYTAEILPLVSFFIVSCLRQRNLLADMDKLALIDPLTGFGNRRAMRQYIDTINTDQSVGILYGDITGLKRINDTMGHNAGDKLIIQVCDCVRKAFSDYRIYRTGGDEFVVICSDIQEDIFRQHVLALQELLKKENAVLSMGVSFRNNIHSKTIDEMISEAETLMYHDKAEYYTTHGIERRH